MFKGQSLTFNFKSYLKRQEKATSKTKWRTAENAIELPQVDLLTRIPGENVLAKSEFSDPKQQLFLARELFNKTASYGGLRPKAKQNR